MPGKIPTVAQLPAGALGLNTADNILYFGTGTEVHALYSVREEYNAPLSFNESTQLITVVKDFVARSTRLYIGGQRYCLDVDYVEVNSTTLQLLSTITQAQVTAGSNIVLDYQILG